MRGGARGSGVFFGICLRDGRRHTECAYYVAGTLRVPSAALHWPKKTPDPLAHAQFPQRPLSRTSVTSRIGLSFARRLLDADAVARQARDFAAIDAEEMGMIAARFSFGPPQFKSPDVIAHLDSRHDPGLGQLDEIAVDRRPIETLRIEPRATSAWLSGLAAAMSSCITETRALVEQSRRADLLANQIERL